MTAAGSRTPTSCANAPTPRPRTCGRGCASSARATPSGHRNTASTSPSADPRRRAHRRRPTARQAAADAMGSGWLTGRLQLAGVHPRLNEDCRCTVVNGVHHPALPAAGVGVLAPLGQQPGPATRALRQAGDPAVPGQDRPRPVLQGSKLRVGADRSGRSDRTALGQGRAASTRHASRHRPSMTPTGNTRSNAVRPGARGGRAPSQVPQAWSLAPAHTDPTPPVRALRKPHLEGLLPRSRSLCNSSRRPSGRVNPPPSGGGHLPSRAAQPAGHGGSNEH